MDIIDKIWEMDILSQMVLYTFFLWLFLLTMIITIVAYSIEYAINFSIFIHIGFIFLNIVPLTISFLIKGMYIIKIVK